MIKKSESIISTELLLSIEKLFIPFESRVILKSCGSVKVMKKIKKRTIAKKSKSRLKRI